MVGSVLALIILLSAFGALKFSIDSSKRATDKAHAMEILQSEIESIRAMDWSTFSALPTAETSVTLNDDFTSDFTTRYTLKRQISTRATDQREVLVKISWQDNYGTTYTGEYLTYVTKSGLHEYYYAN